jgi:hypothetical protein
MHLSALPKCRAKGGRKISDDVKYFGNISEKRPFSEKISDYFFADQLRRQACRAVAPKPFGAKAGQAPSHRVAVSRSDFRKGFRCHRSAIAKRPLEWLNVLPLITALPEKERQSTHKIRKLDFGLFSSVSTGTACQSMCSDRNGARLFRADSG